MEDSSFGTVPGNEDYYEDYHIWEAINKVYWGLWNYMPAPASILTGIAIIR